MKFRLKAGLHIGNDDQGKERTYKPGDTIVTDQDLLSITGGDEKFQRLDGFAVPSLDVPRPKQPLETREDYQAWLETLDDESLRVHAEERQVDIKGSRTRDDVIRALMAT